MVARHQHTPKGSEAVRSQHAPTPPITPYYTSPCYPHRRRDGISARKHASQSNFASAACRSLIDCSNLTCN